jgi:hypothetical protein
LRWAKVSPPVPEDGGAQWIEVRHKLVPFARRTSLAEVGGGAGMDEGVLWITPGDTPIRVDREIYGKR